ncbi:MAG: hypothetical protein K0U98_27230 [Deltaproteobacteria bacterium]|nr:hypothetical protein [Deltaproteobacteria bacterium]
MTCQKQTLQDQTLLNKTMPVPSCDLSRGLRQSLLSLTLLPLLFLLASAASAHVQLDAPDGGEVFVEGDQVEIRWQVLIEHNLDNWDLWYSTTGDDGPWIPIATDLPAGDGTEGAMHNHFWTVPGEDSEQVRVRVRQDNLGMDYYDISETDLTIMPGLPSDMIFADGFESGDTGAWTAQLP